MRCPNCGGEILLEGISLICSSEKTSTSSTFKYSLTRRKSFLFDYVRAMNGEIVDEKGEIFIESPFCSNCKEEIPLVFLWENFHDITIHNIWKILKEKFPKTILNSLEYVEPS